MKFELMASMMCADYGHLEKEVRALEEGGFRGTVMNAVIKAYEKNFDLK